MFEPNPFGPLRRSSCPASFKAHNQIGPLQNGHATRAATPTPSGQPLLRLKQVSFAWPAAPPSFANLNLVAQPGELVLVSGRVACGKSTLLQLILGELRASAGEIQLSNGGGGSSSSSSSQFKVAYAPQRPWIFAGSVRENVLFGEPLQLERYYEVLRVSCLLADLRRLAHFDRTLIGERGATLSEGQRARISLARALYQRAHLYLLDDPLAAVDALVARHIFQEALLGFLRAGGGGGGGCGCDGVAAPPTVILVTHQVQYLRQADKLLLMLPSGAHFGTFQELELAGALAGLQLAAPPEAEAHTLLQPEESQEGAPPASGGELERDQTIKRLLLTSPPRARQDRGQPNESSLSEFECAQQHDELAGLRDERRQLAGAARALAFYLNQAGSRTEWLLFAAANVACRLLFMGLNIWLNYWAGLQGERAAANDAAAAAAAVAAADSFAASRLSLWGALEVALAMWLLLVGAAALRSRQFYALSSRAARLIHARLIQSLLRTNMSFHERTPRGQLINRLSADISHMDTAFVVLLNDLSLSGLSVAFIFASIIASSPSTALAIALIIALDVAIFKHFHKLMGALKRLEGCRRASLYSHVATTLEGLPIVRSANKRHLFLARFLHLLDQNSSVRFLSLSLRRFIIGSLDSVLILFYVSLIGLDVRDTLQGQARFAFVGLNLIVQLARICQLTFTRLIEFYTTIPSMERLGDFCDLSSELAELLLEHQLSAAANNRLAELRQLLAPEPVEVEVEAEAQAGVDERAAGRQLLARAGGKLAHMERAMKRANFTRGRLEFAGVSLKFANTQEPALKQLSFRLEPGEKVGVVGRTGAGKSSLITALFRLHHFEGFILIDGQNTKELSPDSLRNSISIIPQEPTLFSGTLRHNLDPLGEHPDAELWRALQVVQLDGLLGSGGADGKSETNSEADPRTSALQRPVGESGANFSIGQRQLICLARALLRRNKLLVLDEATANVDQLTDLQLQAAIRSEFAHCTVLTVAHRLDTVLDSDRIMVMQAGRLCEFGRPRELLERGRLLNEMIESTGHQQAAILRARILATSSGSSSSNHNESSAADDDENSPTYM